MVSRRSESGRSLRRLLGPSGGRARLILAIGGAVVLLDAITKAVAVHDLEGRRPVEILGGAIRFDLYRNFAGPNNILPGHTVAISLFAIAAVIVLLGVAHRVSSTAGAVAVGLLLGGAIGNLLDRLLREPGPLRGGVVDWLRLTDRTQSMNLADLAIDGAIAVLLIGALLGWWSGRRSSEGDPLVSRPPG
ncbi:MAG TPA: signal peptidase II [Solirubrobacterales bacterium]|nr:signal peptidase II [Solirubrobacterales bacterium]